MTMIHLTIRIVTDPKKRDDAVTILQSMATRARTLSGCIACRAYSDVQEGHILMFEAIWENQEDMNLYLRTSEFRNVLLAVDMGVEMPDIRYETVSNVTGIEAIEKARNGDWVVD